MAVVKLVWVVAASVSYILAIGTQVGVAHAQSGSDQAKRSTVLPPVRATTDCIAASVSRQPGITTQSPSTTLAEAIRRVIAGGACDEAIERMVGVYDRTYGQGSGIAFFTGPYGNDLPRAVRSRLTGTQTAPTISTGQINPQVPVQMPSQDRQAPSVAQRVLPPVQSFQPVQSVPVVNAPSSNQTANPNRPKTLAEIESERAFKAVVSNIAGIFALAGVATIVLFLIGLGSRWVVFTDNGDLGRTSLIILAPIATALAIAFEAWRLSLSGSINVPIYDFVTGHWTIMTILLAGSLVWIWGFAWTLFSSIMCNGLIVGLPIGILKIIAILCMALALFGTLYLGEGKEGRYRARPNFAMWLVFGLIIWFASKLINGYRVAERREASLVFQGAEAA